MSVLFVDLVGFTAGADRADPEDVRATLRPYHARDRLSDLTSRATIARARGEDATSLFAEAGGWGRLKCVFEQALALEVMGSHEPAGKIFARLGIPRGDQTAARTAK